MVLWLSHQNIENDPDGLGAAFFNNCLMFFLMFFEGSASEKNGQLNFYAILTLGSSFYQGDVLVGKSAYLVHTFRLRAKQYHGMATPGFGCHC